MLKQKTLNECVYSAILFDNESLFKKYINKLEKPTYHILNALIDFKRHHFLKYVDEKNLNKEVSFQDYGHKIKISALTYALSKNDVLMARLLLDRGVNVNHQCRTFQGSLTPFVMALEKENIKAVELLLDYNVIIDLKNSRLDYVKKSMIEKIQPLLSVYQEQKQLNNIIEQPKEKQINQMQSKMKI